MYLKCNKRKKDGRSIAIGVSWRTGVAPEDGWCSDFRSTLLPRLDGVLWCLLLRFFRAIRCRWRGDR